MTFKQLESFLSKVNTTSHAYTQHHFAHFLALHIIRLKDNRIIPVSAVNLHRKAVSEESPDWKNEEGASPLLIFLHTADRSAKGNIPTKIKDIMCGHIHKTANAGKTARLLRAPLLLHSYHWDAKRGLLLLL